MPDMLNDWGPNSNVRFDCSLQKILSSDSNLRPAQSLPILFHVKLIATPVASELAR